MVITEKLPVMSAKENSNGDVFYARLFNDNFDK